MSKQNENDRAEIKFLLERGGEVRAVCPFHMETLVNSEDGSWKPGSDGVVISEIVSTQNKDWIDVFCNDCIIVEIVRREKHSQESMTVGDLVKKLCDYDLDAPVVLSRTLGSDEPEWYAIKIVDFKPHDRTHLMFTIDGAEPVME